MLYTDSGLDALKAVPDFSKWNSRFELVRGDIRHENTLRAALKDIAVGDDVNAHDRFGDIESVKTVSELFAPISGTVVEVNGRDELPIPQKVALDAEYLRRQSLAFDLRILWLTAVKVLRSDGVSH